MAMLANEIDVEKTVRNKLFDNVDQSKLMSLDEYLTMARKCVSKYAGNCAVMMLRDEEAISFVANHIMMGTCRYSDSRGCSLRTYHVRCAVWAIKRWKSKVVQANTRRDDGDIREPGSLNWIVYNSSTEDDDVLYSKLADAKALEPHEIMMMADRESFDFDGFFQSSCLTDREFEVVKLHYLEHLIPADIARQLNITRERVRQLLVKAVAKMQAYAKEFQVEV